MVDTRTMYLWMEKYIESMRRWGKIKIVEKEGIQE